MDTVDLMQAFCRVVDAGSFSRAAEQLGLSRAVVSKYVRELENRLDSRLLSRTTRSLSLTESGQICYQRCGDILGQIQALEADVLARDKQIQGKLRISVPFTFGEMFIVPHLHELMDQHPALELDISLSDRFVSLVDEHFDLAVRIGQLGDSSLIARRVGGVSVKLCAAPGYLQINGAPESLKDISKHRLLLDSNSLNNDCWQATAADGEVSSIPVSSRVRINSSRAIREMLLRGEGIALCPSFAVDDCLKRGSLIHLLPEYSFGAAVIYVVYPDNRYVPEKVREFIRFMERIVGMQLSASPREEAAFP